MRRIVSAVSVVCLLAAGVGEVRAAPIRGQVVEQTTYQNVRIDGEPFVVATRGNLTAIAGLQVGEQLELVLFLVNGSAREIRFDPGEISAYAEQKKRLVPLYVFSREDVARSHRVNERPAEVGEALARVLSASGGDPRTADWSRLGLEFQDLESLQPGRSGIARRRTIPAAGYDGGLVVVVHAKARAWLIRVPFGGTTFEFRFTP